MFTRYRLESLLFFSSLLLLSHYFSLVEQTMLPLWRFVVVVYNLYIYKFGQVEHSRRVRKLPQAVA